MYAEENLLIDFEVIFDQFVIRMLRIVANEMSANKIKIRSVKCPENCFTALRFGLTRSSSHVYTIVL